MAAIDDLTTIHLDSGLDQPDLARPELLAVVQKVQEIIATFGVANGLALLDATSKIDIGKIPTGAGSGLVADTLRGKADTAFAAASHVGSGGTAHPLAVALGDSGFISGADKDKIDNLESGSAVSVVSGELSTSAPSGASVSLTAPLPTGPYMEADCRWVVHGRLTGLDSTDVIILAEVNSRTVSITNPSDWPATFVVQYLVIGVIS